VSVQELLKGFFVAARSPNWQLSNPGLAIISGLLLTDYNQIIIEPDPGSAQKYFTIHWL